MAQLTQTRAQLRANVRRFTDTGGTNALARHPDADINEYIDRAIGSLHRLLTEANADQRILSSSIISLTSAAGAIYSLPALFDHLISVDLTANGVKAWLTAYEMHERPSLTSPAFPNASTPMSYRLQGATSIEYLPAPTASYSSTLWYVPSPTMLTLDTSTVDTVNRLDDYLIAYAARFVAIKDKSTELVNLCAEMLGEMREAIATTARSRDKNSPTRVVDENFANRWGRRPRGRRW